jgi:hypothetical protein
VASDLGNPKAGTALKLVLAWGLVGIPLAWGVIETLQKALLLFG